MTTAFCELETAWVSYVEAENAYLDACAGETDAYGAIAHANMERAREEVLLSVAGLLGEEPPANLKEVFERYAIDPKTEPPGGGMPLWWCLARMWRDDMHAFLALETRIK